MNFINFFLICEFYKCAKSPCKQRVHKFYNKILSLRSLVLYFPLFERDEKQSCILQALFPSATLSSSPKKAHPLSFLLKNKCLQDKKTAP